MGISTKTKNYVVGRGQVFFAPFVPGTKTPGAFLQLGDAPAFDVNVTSESLEHYSSEAGVKEVDASVTLKTTRKAKLKLDDIIADNVALFLLGQNTPTAVAGASVVDEVIPATSVAKGKVFKLGLTDTDPVGSRNVTTLVLKNSAGSTTYVAGTDYEVDLASGLVKPLVDGAIVDLASLKASYAKVAHTHDLTTSGASATEGSMLFVSHNPGGDDADYVLPYVRLTPDGDYSLIGDTWQEMSFSMDIIKNGDLAAIYRAGAPYVD